LQNAFLPGFHLVEGARQIFPDPQVGKHLFGPQIVSVGDNVPHEKVFILVQRRVKTADGLGRLVGVDHAFDLPGGQVEGFAHLLHGGAAPQADGQTVPLPEPLAKGLQGVGRYADGFGLFVVGAADGLFDPVGRVGGKTETAFRVELVDRVHEAEVALFDQVQEIDAGPVILFGDGDDQAQVGFNDAFFRLGVALFGQPPQFRDVFLADVLQPTNAAEVQGDRIQTFRHERSRCQP
jgi:hypothetical protein